MVSLIKWQVIPPNYDCSDDLEVRVPNCRDSQAGKLPVLELIISSSYMVIFTGEGLCADEDWELALSSVIFSHNVICESRVAIIAMRC